MSNVMVDIYLYLRCYILMTYMSINDLWSIASKLCLWLHRARDASMGILNNSLCWGTVVGPREVDVFKVDAAARHALSTHDLDGLSFWGRPLDVDESSVCYGHTTILQRQKQYIGFRSISEIVPFFL